MLYRACAKLNLTLEILARRADGFHALRSVMVPIGLADELQIQAAESFSFACDPPTLATDNLVVRACEQLAVLDRPRAIALHKRIPVGAGLGGGSADAATVLRAGMDGEFGALDPRDWIADARALGSDVPFFLAGGAALVEGTGERVTPLGPTPPWWVVLAVPAVHVDTADAYRRLAAHRESTQIATRSRNESASIRAGEAFQRSDFAALTAAMTNDFEPLIAAAYPAVAATLDALRAAGAAHAMLSGSGGATFALCNDEASARALATRVRTDAALWIVPLGSA